MNKEEYNKYVKEQNKLAQKQAIVKYKKDIKKNIKKNIEPIKKKSKQAEKITKSAGKVIKNISKSVGYKKKLSDTLMGFANADRVPQQKVGRPPKLFKHTSPFTGKPVPAEVYYEQMRAFKRLQARKVEDAKEQQLREYAKRGIPPNQIENYQKQMAEKIRQQQMVQQLQQQRQSQPNQQFQTQQNKISPNELPNGVVVNSGNKIWRGRRGTVDTDWTAFGRKKVFRGRPEDMWN